MGNVKANINDKLTVKPAPEDVAYFSFKGYGIAISINDSDIDEVFETAKQSLKNTLERQGKEDGRSQGKDGTGEEVRTENPDSKEG